MRFRELPPALQVYILAQPVALLPLLPWLAHDHAPASPALLVPLLVAAALTSSWKIKLSVLRGRLSVLTAVISLAVVLCGVATAVIVTAIGATLTHLVRVEGRRFQWVKHEPWYRRLFNLANGALVTGVAGLLSEDARWHVSDPRLADLTQLLAFFPLYFLLNTLSVSVAVALDGKHSPLRVWREHYFWTAPGYFACSVLAFVIATAYRMIGLPALLLVPTAILIYRASTHYADLLQREHELKEQVEELYRQQAEANHRKDEFLAMLSHELRNPLAAINTAHYLLDQQLLERGDELEPFRRHHAVIGRQAAHLKRLVDDLLEVSRITQGKLELRKETVDLVQVLESALRTVQPLFQAREHQLQVLQGEGPFLVQVDTTRVEQVLINLLSNAAKYTQPSGKIIVSLQQAGPMAEIRIRDNGTGIQPDLLPHIFELFVQDPRTLDRSQGGLGIGLNLVKQLVELHGGTVAASSEGAGRGSEFVVWLPLPEGALAPVPAKEVASPVATNSGHPVLVVDDVKDAADSVAELLASWDYRAVVAYDGAAALRLASTTRPRVVLLDIGLPGRDGYQIAQELRSSFGDEIRLVAITGYGQPEDRERAMTAGFDDHMLKPLNLEELRSMLERLSADSQPLCT